jgi:hypothetical protein
MKSSQDHGLEHPETPGSATYAESLNRRQVTPEQPTDDVLSVETISRIEELHSTVLWAEKERRFGMLRPRRAEELLAAQSAEQEFLDEHGFASYTDFRLRIRRSKVGAALDVEIDDAPQDGNLVEDHPAPPPPPAERPAPLEPRVPVGRWTEDWAIELRREFERRLTERVANAELQLEGGSVRSDHGG